MYMSLFRAILRLTCALTALLLSLLPAQQAERDLELAGSRTAPAVDPNSVPRSYAVVIGVAAYPNLPEDLWLRFAEKDAEAIASVLISRAGGHFPPENVHVLTGAKASLAGIRYELEQWLPEHAQDSDRVLIYFAGHGFVYGGKPYLAPYDFDASRVDSTGYPMEALGRTIGASLRARWKVLITDACHSGAIAPDAAWLGGSLADLSRSLFVLSASRDRESSYEGRRWGGGHGAFTYYVIQGLQGAADETGDGVVTADELGEYVHVSVRNDIRENLHASQNPNFGRGSFASEMPLAFPGIERANFERREPKFGGLVFTSNMDGVSVYLDADLKGTVNRNAPLHLPGLPIGSHTVKGVKTGYEPDGPREEIVYPGEETPVGIRMLFPLRHDQRSTARLEDGLREYQKGGADHYRKAVSLFSAALDTDPKYTQAALYLARSYRDLFDTGNAAIAYRKAIEIDPAYPEARVSYAGMLLDRGDTDEAVRQLNQVERQENKSATALYLTAQAFLMKESYAAAIDAARRSIALARNNPEPHLFLAEGLKLSGACPAAEPEYQSYLKLSDFDSRLAGKLNYYVGGYLIGLGRKFRPSQSDIWKELRGIAWAGLGDCERVSSREDAAIEYYKRALAYGNDPRLHFAIGIAYTAKAEAGGYCDPLESAYLHFRDAVRLNPGLAESEQASRYIAKIDALAECRRDAR